MSAFLTCQAFADVFTFGDEQEGQTWHVKTFEYCDYVEENSTPVVKNTLSECAEYLANHTDPKYVGLAYVSDSKNCYLKTHHRKTEFKMTAFRKVSGTAAPTMVKTDNAMIRGAEFVKSIKPSTVSECSQSCLEDTACRSATHDGRGPVCHLHKIDKEVSPTFTVCGQKQKKIFPRPPKAISVEKSVSGESIVFTFVIRDPNGVKSVSPESLPAGCTHEGSIESINKRKKWTSKMACALATRPAVASLIKFNVTDDLGDVAQVTFYFP